MSICSLTKNQTLSQKTPQVYCFPRHSFNPPAHTTLLVFPLSTSYTHPEIATSSGTRFDFFRYSTSSTTALSRSGNARKLGTFSLSSATASSLYRPHQSARLISPPDQPHRRKHKPEIILDNRHRILVLKRQHPAPRMLDQHNLIGGQQLLADDNGAERVGGRAPCLFLSQKIPINITIRLVSGDRETLTLRMTWASPSSMPNARAGSMRASMHVTTRYFLAGGRARWPLSKLAAYSAEAASTLFWMADILGVVVKARRWEAMVVLLRPRRTVVGAARCFRRRVCWRMLVVVVGTVF